MQEHVTGDKHLCVTDTKPDTRWRCCHALNVCQRNNSVTFPRAPQTQGKHTFVTGHRPQ